MYKKFLMLLIACLTPQYLLVASTIKEELDAPGLKLTLDIMSTVIGLITKSYGKAGDKKLLEKYNSWSLNRKNQSKIFSTFTTFFLQGSLKAISDKGLKKFILKCLEQLLIKEEKLIKKGEKENLRYLIKLIDTNKFCMYKIFMFIRKHKTNMQKMVNFMKLSITESFVDGPLERITEANMIKYFIAVAALAGACWGIYAVNSKIDNTIENAIKKTITSKNLGADALRFVITPMIQNIGKNISKKLIFSILNLMVKYKKLMIQDIIEVLRIVNKSEKETVVTKENDNKPEEAKIIGKSEENSIAKIDADIKMLSDHMDDFTDVVEGLIKLPKKELEGFGYNIEDLSEYYHSITYK